MGTAVKQHLGEYAQTVARFQGASGGLYQGPAMPVGLLGELISQADGIDSSQLVRASTAAVGAHRKKNGFSGFSDFITDFAIEIGSGMVMDYFKKFQEGHDQDEQDREDLIENSHRCADAIDDTVHVANTAITEILHAACQMIDLLTRLLLRRLNPVAEALVPIVTAIGDELIEATHKIIADTCRDRDGTLEKCYELLEQCCESACQAPLPNPVPNSAPCGEQSESQPGSQMGVQTSGQSAPKNADQTVGVLNMQEIFSNQATMPQGLPLPNLLGNFDLNKSFSGVIGGIGLGVAAFGLGALTVKAAEWCQENGDLLNGMFAECPPADGGVPDAPAPEPAPAPAPEPAPAPAPEPQGETGDNLDQVPEPEPPAEKLAHITQQQVPQPQDPPMSSQPTAEGQIHVRKAGNW